MDSLKEKREGIDDIEAVAVWSDDPPYFIVDDAFHSTDELRHLADRIDKATKRDLMEE